MSEEEMTPEKAEEYYNKLFLENKDKIIKNIERLDKKRFALELTLVEKDKEIKRLNNIINKAIEYIEENEYSFIDKHGNSQDIKPLLEILKGE